MGVLELPPLTIAELKKCSWGLKRHKIDLPCFPLSGCLVLTKTPDQHIPDTLVHPCLLLQNQPECPTTEERTKTVDCSGFLYKTRRIPSIKQLTPKRGRVGLPWRGSPWLVIPYLEVNPRNTHMQARVNVLGRLCLCLFIWMWQRWLKKRRPRILVKRKHGRGRREERQGETMKWYFS